MAVFGEPGVGVIIADFVGVGVVADEKKGNFPFRFNLPEITAKKTKTTTRPKTKEIVLLRLSI